ncbi:hypothetical protein [Bradyrhizobium guangzhouense]|uniref:Uncharacterized protein n=1 Tax=Bradyrhizobium guangzhouense TaxID=1325095 RepID=A0AAE6C682_9BRAD|nr:hypothetical protein [Bradyrhizobium guangzhouense]QAU44186.1 hypothetical protein XH91_01650 [Bradyrhizobium guangzhouense]
MKTDTKRVSLAQSVRNPPSIDSNIVVRSRPSSRAGSYVARRFCVDPALADLVADLAGLGEVRS